MPLDAPSPSLDAGEIQEFRAVRARSESLATPLSPEDWMLQSMEAASPIKWNLAHTSWFFETFVLCRYIDDYRPFHDRYKYLFNSYYNLIGDMHPRPHRGMLSRPTAREILEYRRVVTDAVVSLAEAPPENTVHDISRLVEIGCAHEEQHQELLLTDIKHALFQNPLEPAAYEPSKSELEIVGAKDNPAVDAGLAWVEYEGGLADIGVDANLESGDQTGKTPSRFAFDNEGPRHRVFLKPYALAATLTTNREFLAFVDDGGYRDPRWWFSDGWDLARREGWKHPLYWRREGVQWTEFTLFGRRPLDPDAPVSHLSYYEAAAFAEWTGFRLPTEFEWEDAVSAAPAAGRFLGSDGPTAPAPLTADAPSIGGLRQAYGDVWEWTASPYVAYPGYRAARGAIGEYNGKFMSSQMVLRGGSCATPASHVRATYRNFFPPDARWQFSGFRLAKDL